MSQAIHKSRSNSKISENISQEKGKSNRQSEFVVAPHSNPESIWTIPKPESNENLPGPTWSKKSTLKQNVETQHDELTKLASEVYSKYESRKMGPADPLAEPRRSIKMVNCDPEKRLMAGSNTTRPLNGIRPGSPRISNLKTQAGQSVIKNTDLTEAKRGIHLTSDRDYDLFRHRGNSLPDTKVGQKKYDELRQSWIQQIQDKDDRDSKQICDKPNNANPNNTRNLDLKKFDHEV